MESKILLYGGGGHARVVTDSLKRTGIKIAGVFDDNIIQETTDKDGVTLSNYRTDLHEQSKLIIAIGDNLTRKRIVRSVKHKFAKVVDPSVIMASSASVNEGSMILQGAIIQASSSVGSHVIINTGVTVDHDCVIGDFSHLAPRATLCGSVEIGEGAFIGAGSVIIPDIKIGKWVTIGAGAVVIDDMPDFAVAVGNPARVIKYNRPANEH